MLSHIAAAYIQLMMPPCFDTVAAGAITIPPRRHATVVHARRRQRRYAVDFRLMSPPFDTPCFQHYHAYAIRATYDNIFAASVIAAATIDATRLCYAKILPLFIYASTPLFRWAPLRHIRCVMP